MRIIIIGMFRLFAEAAGNTDKTVCAISPWKSIVPQERVDVMLGEVIRGGGVEGRTGRHIRK
jgi:hypothetical protein